MSVLLGGKPLHFPRAAAVAATAHNWRNFINIASGVIFHGHCDHGCRHCFPHHNDFHGDYPPSKHISITLVISKQTEQLDPCLNPHRKQRRGSAVLPEQFDRQGEANVPHHHHNGYTRGSLAIHDPSIVIMQESDCVFGARTLVDPQPADCMSTQL